MFRWIAIAILTLAACGGGRPVPSSGGDQVAAPSIDAGPPAAGCPATWAEITSVAGQSCDHATTPSACNYDEGSCWCGAVPVCSGAARDPDELAREPLVWNCTPKPPAVRPDGCPGEMNDGLACREAGKRCSYGACCVTIMECRGGKWQTVDQECPP